MGQGKKRLDFSNNPDMDQDPWFFLEELKHCGRLAMVKAL